MMLCQRKWSFELKLRFLCEEVFELQNFEEKITFNLKLRPHSFRLMGLGGNSFTKIITKFLRSFLRIILEDGVMFYVTFQVKKNLFDIFDRKMTVRSFLMSSLNSSPAFVWNVKILRWGKQSKLSPNYGSATKCLKQKGENFFVLTFCTVKISEKISKMITIPIGFRQAVRNKYQSSYKKGRSALS